MKSMTRREMLKKASALGGMSILGIPVMADTSTLSPQEQQAAKKKILVIGGHPDDPETGCGGTMIKLQQAGHEVVSVYLTRGQASSRFKSYEEASKTRTKEVIEGCKVMGVRPVFLTQVDGNTEINKERYQEMRELIEKENPDVVLTHWPIDTHRDHRNCSLLVFDAWVQLGKKFEIYYYEVLTGDQTLQFHPTHIVNIDDTAELKHKAVWCHASQDPEDIYTGHGPMEKFRGMQIGCKYGEGFVRLKTDVSL